MAPLALQSLVATITSLCADSSRPLAAARPCSQRLGVGGMLAVLVDAPDHMYFDV